MTLQTPHGAYTISQLFGGNPDMYERFGMIGHNGLDLKGLPRNYCLMPGLVVGKDFNIGGYGNYVKIQDDKNRVWTYGHFANPVEAAGRVELYQDLGEMGKTGYATGIHCHVGVKPEHPDQNNGYLGSIDPLPLILENQLTEQDMKEIEEIKADLVEIKDRLTVLETKPTAEQKLARKQKFGFDVRKIIKNQLKKLKKPE